MARSAAELRVSNHSHRLGACRRSSRRPLRGLLRTRSVCVAGPGKLRPHDKSRFGRAGNRLRCRGAKRPGYEGKRNAERRGACEAPGCCEHPGTLAKRAAPLCDQGGAPLGAPLRCFRHIGPRLRASGSNLPEVVQRAPRARVVSLPVWRSPEPGIRLTAGRAGTASCSTCRRHRKTPLSEQNEQNLYHPRVAVKTKREQNLAEHGGGSRRALIGFAF
jgi:hypothetical protein